MLLFHKICEGSLAIIILFEEQIACILVIGDI